MKPILFNTMMVDAILRGRKTRTTRPFNPAKPISYQIGDILYVREAFRKIGETTLYKASAECPHLFKWKPSIHMPKEAARIFLKVTNVHSQWLNDTTEHQAIEEGIPSFRPVPGAGNPWTVYLNVSSGKYDHDNAKNAFLGLYRAIYPDTDTIENPFVTVIHFTVIPKPQ